MDFRRLFAAVKRFWLVVLGILVLTVLAVALVPSNISPDFEARGTALILSPSTVENTDTGEEIGINPWSRFGASGEGVAATAMIEVLESKAFEQEVMADDAVKEFTVTPNPGGNGAILDISVLASEASSALDGFDLIVDRLVQELDSRQEAAGAPVETRLKAEVLTKPAKATELRGSQTRAMLAIAVLGVIAAVAAAAALDTITSPDRHSDEEDGGDATGNDDASDPDASDPGAEPSVADADPTRSSMGSRRTDNRKADAPSVKADVPVATPFAATKRPAG
ncbi:MAG: hypothetical protein H6517_03965 [Microthrixaceae bacterium]|nr:hypothetical protein [Microthrixaceae bacterium]MCB9386964.1 hypothetical protein [Microthrixaceae bacterium]